MDVTSASAFVLEKKSMSAWQTLGAAVVVGILAIMTGCSSSGGTNSVVENEDDTPAYSSDSKKTSINSSGSDRAFPSSDSIAEYDPEKKVVKDPRDGQTYRTTKIGDQVWMAENLNYRYLGATDDLDSSSFCYNNEPDSCAKYGRLYLWSAAMDSAGIIKGNVANGCGIPPEGVPTKCTLPSSTIRGVCPQGWHLPDTTEWNALKKFIDGSVAGTTLSPAGMKLKSTSGWNWFSGTVDGRTFFDKDGNGTDEYGFAALPAGAIDGDDEEEIDFFGVGRYAEFWGARESHGGCHFVMYNGSDYASASCGKILAASVRCIKD